MTSREELEEMFSQLADAGYEITSPDTPVYNCIAWAAEDDISWWWPNPWAGPPLGGYYWPAGLPLDPTLANFVVAFRRQGYRECETGDIEEGYQKVAIYIDSGGEPTHAARQLPDGQWTSKLGELNDITHATVDAIGGPDGYGEVAQYMRRRIVPNRPGPGASNAAFGGARPLT